MFIQSIVWLSEVFKKQSISNFFLQMLSNQQLGFKKPFEEKYNGILHCTIRNVRDDISLLLGLVHTWCPSTGARVRFLLGTNVNTLFFKCPCQKSGSGTKLGTGSLCAHIFR